MVKTRVQAGFEMVVLGYKDIVSSGLLNRHFWEIHSAAEFATKMDSTLPATGTFLDVGANIGYYSMLFAHAGYNVIAVEPMARNRAAIEGTLCLNPSLRSKVKVVAAALVSPEEVDHTKCLIKSTNTDVNIGNGYLKCGTDVDPCVNGDPNCQVVPVSTLDKTLADLNPTSVDVVKMDVEAYECKVFAGGESLFSKYSPKLFKVETEWGNTKACVNHLAVKHGYKTHGMGTDTGLVK